MKELKDADMELVKVGSRGLDCKLHGAMNKLTKDGIWRCVATCTLTKENNCKAGVQE